MRSESRCTHSQVGWDIWAILFSGCVAVYVRGQGFHQKYTPHINCVESLAATCLSLSHKYTRKEIFAPRCAHASCVPRSRMACTLNSVLSSDGVSSEHLAHRLQDLAAGVCRRVAERVLRLRHTPLIERRMRVLEDGHARRPKEAGSTADSSSALIATTLLARPDILIWYVRRDDRAVLLARRRRVWLVGKGIRRDAAALHQHRRLRGVAGTCRCRLLRDRRRLVHMVGLHALGGVVVVGVELVWRWRRALLGRGGGAARWRMDEPAEGRYAQRLPGWKRLVVVLNNVVLLALVEYANNELRRAAELLLAVVGGDEAAKIGPAAHIWWAVECEGSIVWPVDLADFDDSW